MVSTSYRDSRDMYVILSVICYPLHIQITEICMLYYQLYAIHFISRQHRHVCYIISYMVSTSYPDSRDMYFILSVICYPLDIQTAEICMLYYQLYVIHFISRQQEYVCYIFLAKEFSEWCSHSSIIKWQCWTIIVYYNCLYSSVMWPK